MAKTAKLTGILGLSISLFEAGLKKATNSANKFANNLGGKVLKEAITGPLGAIGAAIAGAFAFRSFVGGIKGAITAGAAMKTLSEQTGVSVGALKTLGYAFKEAYVDSDLLIPSIGKMQKTLFDASKGSAVAQNALGLLHFRVKDILNLAPEEQFRAIGSAIDALGDASTKAGIAQAFFGRQGRELIPVFANLKNLDFEELHESAKVLQDNATAFREIAVAANRAFGAMKGVYLGIAAGLVPALQNLIGSLPKINFTGIGKAIGKAMATAYFYIKGFVTNFKQAMSDMMELGEIAFAAIAGYAESYGSDAIDALSSAFDTKFSDSFWDNVWKRMTDSFLTATAGIFTQISGINTNIQNVMDGLSQAGKVFDQWGDRAEGFLSRLGKSLQAPEEKHEEAHAGLAAVIEGRKQMNAGIAAQQAEATKGLSDAIKNFTLVEQEKDKLGPNATHGQMIRLKADTMFSDFVSHFGRSVDKFAALGGKGEHHTTRRSLAPKWWNESTGRTLQTGSLEGATMANGLKKQQIPLAPYEGGPLNLPSGQRTLDKGAFGHTALVGQRQILDATNSAIASGESRPNHMVRRGDAKRAEDFARSEQKRLMDVGKSIEAGNSILGNISSLLQTSLQ